METLNSNDVGSLADVLAAAFSGFFFRGPKSGYNGSTTHKDKLYFATDTEEIILNDVVYAGKSIKDIQIVKGSGVFEGFYVLKVTTSDGNSKEVALENALLDSSLTKYLSGVSNDIATVSALGGIPAGTTAGDLKKKTVSQILDDLLFPTVYPTFQAPTASLSLKSSSATPALQEIGTTGSTVPTAESFNTGFNQGKIMIAGVEKQKRAGALKEEESFIYINNEPTNKDFPTEIPNGTITYKFRAAYEEGPQPKDSKGGNYQSPLSAGTVDSAPVTVTGVYPYFTNKDNNGAFAKLPLTTSTKLSGLKFVAEGTNKHIFKLPATYTVTKIEMLNTLSNQYEDFGVSRFTKTTENIQVQGKAVSYAVYTRNDSGKNGEATFQITFTKG